MSAANKPYDFPAEYQGFLEDFQNLMKKHPHAAGRFALADLGDQATTKSIGPPSTIWECRKTEWGLVCTHEHPPLV